jgi:radical SAM superfamily enzyme YgiQ (UPF0313 family)
VLLVQHARESHHYRLRYDEVATDKSLRPRHNTFEVAVLLLSTYDLGRQPFGLASPAAWLRRAGHEVVTCDLSREPLDESAVRAATLVAVYLPMHTATRLALPVLDRIRSLTPDATLCAYGLYAQLNASLLRGHGVAAVLGAEAEQELVELAQVGLPATPAAASREGRMAALPRLAFVTPDRSALPPLARYATLQMPDGSRKVTGSTEATRGCKHRCRHCPIVPVYDGQFRVVSTDVVLADVEQQVAAGASHITFGDPDFFNGPTHARRIVEALHVRHPQLTYDVTIKIEHLLRHRELLPLLVETGCLFVTSAVESVDDAVLARLEKGHTRADFVAAVGLCREAGLLLVPTFVAFTPWTTLDGYRDLLQVVASLDLVEHVAPVQWGIRLLVTEGSRLLELEDIRAQVARFDPLTLTRPWTHQDPRVDALQQAIMRLVGVRTTSSRPEIFERVRDLSALAAGERPAARPRPPAITRAAIPYLNEPWYC